ncbi:M14 family metallopeptidase [Catenuloplanes japonicus]|uniref:M14 family metallopeptidase n=1 Tax=Catenuloplanes japonicus TaxID=33876 RepID=UPI0005253DC9|nr:M14 family metallopeptidase [Catenuloplanes japonicus]
MRAAAAAVLVLAAALAPALPAHARSTTGHLEVYTGTVTPDQVGRLRALGVDTGHAGEVEVVLSPRQAAKLAGQGLRLTPRTVRGESASETLRAQARAGWTAYRSYSEPGGLRDELTATAARYPELTKVATIGRTLQGKPIIAVKVTRQARTVPDGKRPSVLYAGAQHAREWITPEMVRRLYHHVLAGYGTDPQITRLLDTTELWFLPVANPDGYDHTFTEGNRLWRKNLRDNDGDGKITTGDGVDLNRNFGYRWGYDDEGSSKDPAAETYRGTAAQSEPETRALDALFARVGFEFFINYHSAAQLLLYGVGWQVATPSPDDVIYQALAGDDAHPAVAGYDPDLAAELYTTNGDTDSHAAEKYGTLGFTPEMSTCASAADSVPDDRWKSEDCASEFTFPDDEALIQAEFTKNLPFAMSVAASAKDPSHPVSVLGRTAPDFAADPFDVSYGTSQQVAVVARRALRRLDMQYTINGGTPRRAPARQWNGGTRYGTDGTDYYAEFRATVPAQRPGDRVEVWFTGLAGDGRAVVAPRFTYTVADDIGGDVLILAAEDVTGTAPEQPGTSARYAELHAASVRAAGYSTDVYDLDTHGRTAPHPLGVLSHYRAVVWETGDDSIPRDKGQPVGTVTAAASATELAVRDYLNEGGKLLVGGQNALYPQSLNGGVVYRPSGPPECQDAAAASCLGLVNDFPQYWLGADRYLNDGGTDGATRAPHALTGTGGFAGWSGTLDAGQKHTASFVTRSGSRGGSRIAGGWARTGPAPYAPRTGANYVWSGETSSAYKRLTSTLAVPADAAASLRFAVSHDTEKNWDFLIVEAHRAGQDDWTTLPEAGGRTSTAPGESCPADLAGLHPFLTRYQTRSGSGCTSVGTTGRWNAATGSSGGWQDWSFDLSAYAGSTVEVSITYVTDWGTNGLGVFIDDASFQVSGVPAAATSFETDLGGWRAEGPVPWTRTAPPFAEGSIVTTPATVYLGFGLEGLAAASRDDLVRRALKHLLGGAS